jgi:dihydrofolate reductase
VTLAIIAAQSENRVIGRGLEIPWQVKGEQLLFKKITMDGTLIMGRKTYDSIGRPLPGRITIVVSRDRQLHLAGCQTATSLDAAIELAGETERPIFISGGGELYRQAMPLADVLHLTTIHLEVSGDIFFPEVPEAFKLLEEKHYSSNINYTYRRFERRAKL